MKFNYFFSIFIFSILAFLIACQQDEPKSPAHTQAVYWNETIEDLRGHLEGRVDELAAENQELIALAVDNPTPAIMEQLKRHKKIVERYEEVLDKQKSIIEINKNYLDESASATSNIQETRIQHRQIHKNLITVQEEVTQITEEINAFLSMYDKLEKEILT